MPFFLFPSCVLYMYVVSNWRHKTVVWRFYLLPGHSHLHNIPPIPWKCKHFPHYCVLHWLRSTCPMTYCTIRGHIKRVFHLSMLLMCTGKWGHNRMSDWGSFRTLSWRAFCHCICGQVWFKLSSNHHSYGTGQARLIWSHLSARISFKLSGNLN